jgi:HEAT repeat protein
MGWLGLFGGSSDKKNARTIEKALTKIRNPHVQAQERQRVIEQLRDIGTPEAVDALLQRFTMRTPGAIVDEDEKRLAYESLLKLGDVCIEPIERFVRADPNIYWPLRALTEIAGDERAIDLILSALGGAEHGYNTETERREQLVANLREFTESDRVLEVLIQLTRDESIDVRISAIDGLAEFSSPEVPRVLAECLSEPEQELRVRSTILDILAERQIPMGEYRQAVEPHLPSTLHLDDKGILVRK